MNTNFFSYHSPEIIVSKDMCDYNGHMNVTYYYKLFDSVYSSFYIEKLGTFITRRVYAPRSPIFHFRSDLRGVIVPGPKVTLAPAKPL